MIASFGLNGALVVPKDNLNSDGADLVPGSGLRWPPCECGGPKCPDAAPDEVCPPG
ncbi:hypothetical protein ACIOJD_04180 [Streptomyces sp. NPDC088116]|uniref:hypothetical protein n=1 Tax=Streptomyces sp. NPDC088116 TaxID=3365825 RepID=UPI00381FE828